MRANVMVTSHHTTRRARTNVTKCAGPCWHNTMPCQLLCATPARSTGPIASHTPRVQLVTVPPHLMHARPFHTDTWSHPRVGVHAGRYHWLADKFVDLSGKLTLDEKVTLLKER
jgi:hypothetical protein